MAGFRLLSLLAIPARAQNARAVLAMGKLHHRHWHAGRKVFQRGGGRRPRVGGHRKRFGADRKTEKSQKVYKTEDGLANRVVTGIAVDKKTGDSGSPRSAGSAGSPAANFTITTNLTSGLANDIVYAVAIQGEFVWVATTAGISRYEHANRRVVHLQ